MIFALLLAVASKPSVAVVLNGDCPCNELCAPELNALAKQLSREKIAFSGIVDLPAGEVEPYRSKLALSFSLYADPQLKKIKGFGAKYRLELVVRDTKGNRVRRFAGYDRAMIVDLAKLLSRLAKRPIRLDPTPFPETRRIGCAFEPEGA